MRKWLTRVLFVSASALTLTTTAQTTPPPCPAKGIRTNPAAFYDPEHPNVAAPFDWLAPIVDQYRINWNLSGVPTQTVMPTPFSQASNNPPMDFKKTSLDRSADGWELIKQELGYNDDGSLRSTCVNPYVILYNKYLGTLRVYYAIGNRQGSYAYSQMQLTYDTDADVTHKTGALNHVTAIGVPLQDTKPGSSDGFTVVNAFDNVLGDWFVADFPMDYDPCTCLNQAKFKIAITLIQSSHITLAGNINATLTSIDNGKSTGTNAADNSSSRSTLSYINGGLTAGFSSYNGLSDLVKNLTNKDGSNAAAVRQLGTNLGAPTPAAGSTPSFFDSVSGVLPYVGAAVSLLDFFIGGGQEAQPQQVVVQPMAFDGTITLQGDITATVPWGGTDIRVPGSKLGTVLPETPFYNEVLGVFNLLEAPSFYEATVQPATTGTYASLTKNSYIQLASDLKYVTNPASGLVVNSIKAAVVETEAGGGLVSTGPSGYASDFTFEESPAASTFRTDYFDAGCLTSTRFRKTYVLRPLYYNSRNPPPLPVAQGTNRQLKLMIDFARVDGGKHVLLVQVYPINIVPVDISTLPPASTGTCATPLLAPQSNDAVTSFCNSNAKYTAAVSLRSAGPTKPRASQADLTQFTAFPNPGMGTTTIRFAVEEPGQVLLVLRDALGKTVREVINYPLEVGLRDQQVDTHGLAPGIYYAVLKTAKRLQTLKIVVENP